MRPYFTLQEAVRAFVISEVVDALRVPEGQIRLLTVSYDQGGLTPTKMRMRFDVKENVTADKYSGVVASRAGEITVGSSRNFVVTKYRRREEADERLSSEEHAAKCAWILVRPVMDEVYRHLFGHLPGLEA
jgi:hypothetical protein